VLYLYQLGLGFADPYSPNSNPKSYFGIVGQIGIAIHLLKIKED